MAGVPNPAPVQGDVWIADLGRLKTRPVVYVREHEDGIVVLLCSTSNPSPVVIEPGMSGLNQASFVQVDDPILIDPQLLRHRLGYMPCFEDRVLKRLVNEPVAVDTAEVYGPSMPSQRFEKVYRGSQSGPGAVAPTASGPKSRIPLFNRVLDLLYTSPPERVPMPKTSQSVCPIDTRRIPSEAVEAARVALMSPDLVSKIDRSNCSPPYEAVVAGFRHRLICMLIDDQHPYWGMSILGRLPLEFIAFEKWQKSRHRYERTSPSLARGVDGPVTGRSRMIQWLTQGGVDPNDFDGVLDPAATDTPTLHDQIPEGVHVEARKTLVGTIYEVYSAIGPERFRQTLTTNPGNVYDELTQIAIEHAEHRLGFDAGSLSTAQQVEVKKGVAALLFLPPECYTDERFDAAFKLANSITVTSTQNVTEFERMVKRAIAQYEDPNTAYLVAAFLQLEATEYPRSYRRPALKILQPLVTRLMNEHAHAPAMMARMRGTDTPPDPTEMTSDDPSELYTQAAALDMKAATLTRRRKQLRAEIAATTVDTAEVERLRAAIKDADAELLEGRQQKNRIREKLAMAKRRVDDLTRELADATEKQNAVLTEYDALDLDALHRAVEDLKLDLETQPTADTAALEAEEQSIKLSITSAQREAEELRKRAFALVQSEDD